MRHGYYAIEVEPLYVTFSQSEPICTLQFLHYRILHTTQFSVMHILFEAIDFVMFDHPP